MEGKFPKIRKSRREFLRLAAIATGATVLAGCAPPTPVEEAVVPTPAPKEPVEILVMDRNIPQDVEFRKELAERFMKEHPDIKVTVEAMPMEYIETILARVAAGTAGDLFRWLVQVGVGKLAARGLLYEFEPFIEADNYDLSPFFEQGLDSCSWGGKLYSIPVNGHSGVSGLYYMPELFQEQGVEEPSEDWTYEDLADAMVKMTKDTDGDGKTDQWGIWTPPWYEAWMTPIRAHGGWPLDETGTKARWRDPGTIAGVQWHVDVIHKYKAHSPGTTYDMRLDLWASRKLAMLQSGLWEAAYLKDVTPEDASIGLVPMPKGPSGFRAGSMGVNFFPIWRSSRHPQEAWEFYKFMCSKEVGVENVERIGEPGLRYDVWDDPKVKDNPLIAPHAPLMKEAKRFPSPANARDSENLDVSNPILEAMYVGELSVEEGTKLLQEKVQEVLDMPPPTAAV